MTHGLGEVRRIAQEHGSDLALVLNHSGGKDLPECWDLSARTSRTPLLTR